MRDRSSSMKQPMKKSWGHPQQPQQLLHSCVHGELLDYLMFPVFPMVILTLHCLTPFTNGLLDILAFGPPEDERCHDLGTATA